MKRIILVSGKSGHGKDQVSQFLKHKLPGKTLVVHYADYLKYICKQYLGWDGNKDRFGRNLLQKFGTDIVRVKKNKPSFWVDAVNNLIEVLDDEFDYFLIPDTRFPNEILDFKLKYSFKNIISVRVERLNFESELTDEQKHHPSETSLDNYDFDYYIKAENNLNSLEIEVEKFICWLQKEI